MSDRFLEQLYPLPRPLETYEQWQYDHHADLPAMSVAELERHLRCLQRRLDYERRPHAWLVERQAALTAALSKAQAARPPPAD